MYIDSVMSTDLITVSPKTTLVQARELMDQHRIEHLLVIKNCKLAGVVSDHDLKQNWASPATALSAHELSYLLQSVTVSMIMVKAVVTATPDTTVERAAWIMQTNNISSLPIMSASGELVGIVTSSDVRDVLLTAIGMSEDSRRLSLFVDNQIGRLATVTTALSKAGINIQNFFCYPVPGYKDVSQLVIRVYKTDGERAAAVLEAEGFKVISSYSKDITPFLPEGCQRYQPDETQVFFEQAKPSPAFPARKIPGKHSLPGISSFLKGLPLFCGLRPELDLDS